MHTLRQAGFGVILMCLCWTGGFAIDDTPIQIPAEKVRQFDFWVGDWDVTNKRANHHGQWAETGTAKAKIRSALGGKAIIEQWSGQGDYYLRGFSLRSYNPTDDRWRIILNWHTGTPALFHEMTGGFTGDQGEFFPASGPRETRFAFSNITANSCQWDRATLGSDRNWNTNWIMEFSRTGAAREVDAETLPIEAPIKQRSRAYPMSRQLDRIIGTWEGKARRLKEDGTWEDGTAIRRATSMLDGFGILQLTEYSWGEESVSVMAFDENEFKWHEIGKSSEDDAFHWLEGFKRRDNLRMRETDESKNGVMHYWGDLSQDAYTWVRETTESSSDDRGKPVLEVKFIRSSPEGRIEYVPRVPRFDLDEKMRYARRLVTEQRFEAAEIQYRMILDKESENERARFMLGYCVHVQKRYDEAMECYQKTVASTRYKALSHYNMACIHSIRKDLDDALEQLKAAIDAGYSDYVAIRNDEDFNNLKSDKRFDALVPKPKR